MTTASSSSLSSDTQPRKPLMMAESQGSFAYSSSGNDETTRRKVDDSLTTVTPVPIASPILRPLNLATSSQQSAASPSSSLQQQSGSPSPSSSSSGSSSPASTSAGAAAAATSSDRQDQVPRKSDKRKGSLSGSGGRGNDTTNIGSERLGSVGEEPGTCGGTIYLTTIPSIIRSPGWEYNQKYPPNSHCVWTLLAGRMISDKSDSPPAIKIKVRHLELEDDIDCRYDYLDLNGDRKLCGLIIDKEIMLNMSSARLTFNTDNNYG